MSTSKDQLQETYEAMYEARDLAVKALKDFVSNVEDLRSIQKGLKETAPARITVEKEIDKWIKKFNEGKI